MNHYYPLAAPNAIHPSPFLDDMQCFTDYEPRSLRNSSLKSQVIAGLAATEDAPGDYNADAVFIALWNALRMV